jgi:hypothetical protein
VVDGPRLADLEVMASTEGAPIPRVYGRARLSGQVIWATNLEESVSTSSETTGGGKGGGGGSSVTTTTTTYSYFANLAVGLCEGPIGAVLRIWADGKPLDTSGLTLRTYIGDETQNADPLILAKQGARRPIAGSPMSCSNACRWRISATAFRNCRSRWCGLSAGSSKWCGR